MLKGTGAGKVPVIPPPTGGKLLVKPPPELPAYLDEGFRVCNRERGIMQIGPS
jgi:hypothetical protein